jgi:hypothetical protein
MCFGEMSFLAVFFSGEDWLQHQINSDEVVVEKWLTPPKRSCLYTTFGWDWHLADGLI